MTVGSRCRQGKTEIFRLRFTLSKVNYPAHKAGLQNTTKAPSPPSMGGDRGEGEKYSVTPTPPSPLKGEGLILTPLTEPGIENLSLMCSE